MSARDLPEGLFASLWQHLPAQLRADVRGAVGRGLKALKTPEPLNLAQWAAKHFYLSAESSQSEQRWRAYPYQVGLLSLMGDDGTREVDMIKSARVGYTKMLLASIAFDAAHKRRNQAVWQPTDDDSDEFCKAELEPMLRDVAAMREVFPEFMAKSKANTLNMKKFLGSLLYLKGGKSAGNYRRMTLASAKLDELDGFDAQIEKSSDPWTLANKRLEGATYPKMLCGSTPRVHLTSHIEARWNAADVRLRYQIACPHCGVEHPLMWGGKDKPYGMKWDFADPEGSAHHVCPHCRKSISQADFLRLWQDACWVSECGQWRLRHDLNTLDVWWEDGAGQRLAAGPAHVAVHVWTAYSPQVSWGALVREFLDASARAKVGDKAALQGFVNETLGETWKPEVDEVKTHELQQRAEAYPLRTCPRGVLQLVCGVDVQDNRFECVVWGMGRGEEMWVVDYTVIPANPADERDWEERLLPYLSTRFAHQLGGTLAIHASAIDTGGHFTHQAYNFCREHQARRVHAIKGDHRDGQPIKGKSGLQDVNHRGRVLKSGVRLWFVGTDTAKDLFFGRLKVTQPGPGYVHFSRELPLEFYAGLTAEVRVPVRTALGERYRWVKRSARNEPLDCTVYALFASHASGHHTFTDKAWERLEAELQPDLFDAPAPAHLPAHLLAGANGLPSALAPADGLGAQPAPIRTQQPASVRTPAPMPAPGLAGIASADWLSRL